jgi:ElaB/YqjD/DUF883 family membrane-anchored ribosome-binding protein
MNTTMPSGYEVESAAFHEPVETSTSIVQRVQRKVSGVGTSARDRAKAQVANAQASMRTNPMKWAGIAAGGGFALGLIGRLLQARRNRRLQAMPDLVIIDSTC